jgi:hypothetical protein
MKDSSAQVPLMAICGVNHTVDFVDTKVGPTTIEVAQAGQCWSENLYKYLLEKNYGTLKRSVSSQMNLSAGRVGPAAGCAY